MGWFFRGASSSIGDEELRAGATKLTLPAGRYSVSVRLIEAKNLQAIKAFNLLQTLMSFSIKTQTVHADRLPNVIGKVELQRAGFEPQKRKTVVEKETASPLWNQLFYFEDLEVAPDELEACNVVINLCDKSGIGKALVIGSLDINLAAVYHSPNHEYWNQWYSLTDFTGRRSGSMGEVCLCVTVLREGETAMLHMDETYSDDEEETALEAGQFETEKQRSRRLAKAERRLRAKQDAEEAESLRKDVKGFILKANVYNGREFPRMDRFGSAGLDAYLKINCGSAKESRTRVITSANPDWNQEVVVRLLVPGGVSGLVNMPPLRMSVMDKDYGNADDHVASTSLSLNDIWERPKAYLKPKWYCFYGGLRGMEVAFFSRVSKLAKRMNAGYIDGAAYRGRTLMSFELQEENRKNRYARAKKSIAPVIEKMGKEWYCFLHSQIMQVELFQTNSKGKMLSIDLGMGLDSTSSPSVLLRSEGGSLSGECYANVQCLLPPLLVKVPTPYEGPLAGTGAPDVFVNINVLSGSGSRRVGYCRIPVSELMPVNETLRPISTPTNAEFPNGWTIQGWFPLRADALSNHKLGKSRRAENVKPIGQVLLRLMLRGSSIGKRATGQVDEVDNDEAMSMHSDAAAAQAERRADMERKAESRGMRVAENVEPEFIDPLPTRKFMLRMKMYQARDLPAADAHGSSDPFAVLRIGRNIIETPVRRATTSPAWFQEMYVQVDLPLVVKDKKRLPDGTLVTDNDDTDSDDDNVLLDPSKLVELKDADGSSSDSDDGFHSNYDEDMMEKGVVKKQKKFTGMGGGGDPFSGIAWWAAPSMNVMVFDRDEGIILGDNDPLSVISLPLIHPAQLEAERRGGDDFSVLASSILSFYSKFSLDSELPDRYDNIANYKIGALSDEPEWYPMRHLNPQRGLSVSQLDSGGYILMHYELLPYPEEGILKFAGLPDSSFRSSSLLRLNKSAIKPLEDNYGSTAISVEIILLGVRGLTPYRGSAVTRPMVEFELNGVTPLYYGATSQVARSRPSSYPCGPNANCNGQKLRLCGMMTKLDKVHLSLSIRVLDGKAVTSHIIATNEHKLRIRDSEKEETAEFVSRLKSVKLRKPTGEELRALEVAEMSGTVSDSEFEFGTETTLFLDESDTVTNEWSDDSSSYSEAPKPGSFFASLSGKHSGRSSVKDVQASKSMSKSQRSMSITGGNSMKNKSKKTDAVKPKIPSKDFKMIRTMDGKRKYIPMAEFIREQKKLKAIDEENSDSDNGSEKTYVSGANTISDVSTVSNDIDEQERIRDEILNGRDGESESDEEVDQEEAEEESEDEEEQKEETTVTFDDGTGKLPEWMEDRMILAGGLLENEIAPLEFMTIPVYHAKGFADNTSEKELAGFVKCAIRSLPLAEDEEFIAENLLEKPVSTSRAIKEAFNSKAKKQRENKAHNLEMQRWKPEEEFASMAKDEFDERERIAGGGPLAAPPTEVTVRIYVVRGRDLRTSDPTGLCDPYLVVNQRGLKKRYGKREDKIDRTLSPWFYKVFQFTTDVPGNNLVDIHVYDWEKRGKDILLGTCTIDIEDRYFSPLWTQQLSDKPPLELRPIYLPGVDMAQGHLELIVEVHDGAEVSPPFNLTPPPVMEVELRCVTFGARKMVNKDVGGKNDLFFKISLVGLDRTQTRFSEGQETDTHWFATDGRASFNFRNIFRFELPVSRAALRIAAFDRDLFSSNDAVGEVTIPLSSMCRQLMKAVSISPDGEMASDATVEIKSSLGDFSSFSFFEGATEGKWFKLFHPSKPNECQGEVEIMLSLLPVRKAESRPVGKGREAPNRDPELREPVRARLSLMDPIGSLSLILGPEMMRKILIAGCLLLFIGVCAALTVFIVNDVVGAYIQIAIQKQAKILGITDGAPTPAPIPFGR